jgi:hypothetical protein
MSKSKKASVNVKGNKIDILAIDGIDYISLSDMSKAFEGGTAIIEQWIRNKNTIEFLGIWEKINNPDFNTLEFEGIKNEAGTNRFYLSVGKWIKTTAAIGLKTSSGRYGGTFAHKDIAFEFGSWLSPEFKLYLIKEFQRLKDEEAKRLSLDWNLHRTLAKVNYRIHTDAIKENILPPEISKKQKALVYANEADLLNVALFGMTAKEWRQANPENEGNIRDHSTIEQLLVLANLESLNAEYIRMGIDQHERLDRLNKTAIEQMKSILKQTRTKKLD